MNRYTTNTIFLLAAAIAMYFYGPEQFQTITIVIGVLAFFSLVLPDNRNRRRRNNNHDEQRRGLFRRKPHFEFSDGLAFEAYLQRHYRNQGFQVQTTPTSGDYGVDLLLHKGNPRKHKIAVQAKNTRRPVGIAAVQQVSSGQTFYNAQEAWVVSSNTYTPAAKRLANATNVRLYTLTPTGRYYEHR